MTDLETKNLQINGDNNTGDAGNTSVTEQVTLNEPTDLTAVDNLKENESVTESLENLAETERSAIPPPSIDSSSKLNNVEVIEEGKTSPRRLGDIMDKLNANDEVLTYSSDECEVESSDTDSSDSSESSSSSSDEESDSEDDDKEANNEKKPVYDEDIEEGDDETGPIHSKNEVVDEVAPILPENFKIDEKAPLEFIGEVISAVEKSVIIKANISGEFRILKENSILCFEDRQVLGPLFEVFGRLQAPFYRVKFNSDSDLMKFKEKIGSKVFYVVPDSQFIYTDSIKVFKGTDASNWNDEEIPEEEQEFSDDEKEAASKSKKKKNKKKNSKDNNRSTNGEPPKKITQYKPVYADYKSVSEITPATAPEQKSVQATILPQAPVAPVPDPQDQMRKLQQQFLEIHKSNNMKRNHNRDEPVIHQARQFVPPSNMQYASPQAPVFQNNNQAPLQFQSLPQFQQQPFIPQQQQQSFVPYQQQLPYQPVMNQYQQQAQYSQGMAAYPNYGTLPPQQQQQQGQSYPPVAPQHNYQNQGSFNGNPQTNYNNYNNNNQGQHNKEMDDEYDY